MLRAEIAHLVCEQIARGGMRAERGPGLWREPMRYSGESEDAYARRKSAARLSHIDAATRAYSDNMGRLDTCKRAEGDLRIAGDVDAADAVRVHRRQQWGSL